MRRSSHTNRIHTYKICSWVTVGSNWKPIKERWLKSHTTEQVNENGNTKNYVQIIPTQGRKGETRINTEETESR